MKAHDRLPHALTSFVGRKREAGRVRTLVLESRLLTLTGPGGSGKTRLATEVAAKLTSRFRDGVFLAELAPLGDGTLVDQVVASVLGVAQPPGRHLAAALSDHLRPRQLLLVIDNCEHLVAEVASLVDPLLRSCPDLQVLATSRAALGIDGERVWSVPPMATSEAVALLFERARAARAGFATDRQGDELAAEICGRLDGMPLAIELAAARLKTLTLEELAHRLGDRFGLLTDSSRTSLPQHRTLRAAMAWSHDLLPASAQVLWRRISVFAGGFELEAAEAICSDGSIDPHQVLADLTTLVDSSIVNVSERQRASRFQVLETVREFGRIKLQESGERPALQRRHLDWYLALARRAEPEWRGRDQASWLDLLDHEIDNFRAALEFSRGTQGLTDSGLELVSALWLLWHSRHIAEGRQWLDRLLKQPLPSRARAYALNVAGFLAYVQGDTASALPLLKESLNLNETLGDVAGANFSLVRLGIGLYYHNDLAEASSVLDDALAKYRRSGDRVGIYVASYELAEALTMRGEFARARELHEESLSLKEQQGDAWHIALSRYGLGLLAWLEGDLDRAVVSLRECLSLRRDLDEHWGIARTIEALAWVEASRGAQARAAHLLGAADAMNERLSAILSPNYQAHHDRCVAAVREALTDAAFRSAFAAGRGLSWSQAVDYGLSDTPRKSKRAGDLTSRQREIASFVAGGLTNRDIASRLSLSERTVDAHLEHIMNKLGYHSRAQIAAWVATRVNAPNSAEI